MPLSIIEGPYLQDVLDQSRALRATERALTIPSGLQVLATRLSRGESNAVVLTGMGSSYHALYPLQGALVRQGFTSIMVETSELLFDMSGLLRPGTLLVVVSQSGASVEIVRLLDLISPGMDVIAVTNTPGSPLAAKASVSLFTQAGSENTVSCKTYLTALLALSWLSGLLCGDELEPLRADLRQASSAVESYLNDWRRHVESLIPEMAGIRDLFLVGRGASQAAAGVGGLIIKESAHFHAEGMSSAAFRHGPFEMISPSTFVAVFQGNASIASLNQRLYDDVRRAGSKAALVGQIEGKGPFRLPPGPDCIRPILEMLPVEMMSFALAAIAGREAGKFERGSKITTVE